LKLYSTGTKASDIVTQIGVRESRYIIGAKCERQEKIIGILRSAPCAATALLQELLAAIEQMVNDEYNVNTLCEALEVAKDTYYNHTVFSILEKEKSLPYFHFISDHKVGFILPFVIKLQTHQEDEV